MGGVDKHFLSHVVQLHRGKRTPSVAETVGGMRCKGCLLRAIIDVPTQVLPRRQSPLPLCSILWRVSSRFSPTHCTIPAPAPIQKPGAPSRCGWRAYSKPIKAQSVCPDVPVLSYTNSEQRNSYGLTSQSHRPMPYIKAMNRRITMPNEHSKQINRG